ncbi:MAG TPA: 3D domain-containing protein [Pyrinomonadaceae bacterium]|nr:3D domain-containing protein [Pyrinomonadaceae bacterium]
MKYSIFNGSALVAGALLTSSLILSATTSSAETLPSRAQQQKSIAEASNPVTVDIPSKGSLGQKIATEEAYVVPATSYVATAYSLRGRTASGLMVSKGLIAADPRHLPLGSRVRIQAGAYSGDYLVADTGGLVRGRRIDIWIPSSREAMRFGRRTVKLTVLSLGRRKK